MRFAARWSPVPPLDAAKGGFIAEGYDEELDRCAPPRATGAAPSPSWKAATARRPGSPRSRSGTMPCSATMSKCRPGTPTSCWRPTAASPTARPWPARALQQPGAARGSQPRAGGRRPCACRSSRRISERADRAGGREAPPISATADASPGSTSPPPCRARREGGWVRPALTRRPAWRSKAGATRWSNARWPARASASSPTTARLGPADRLWLITGPNMGGKSTFLRQVALIACLRRPAASCPRPAPRSAWSTACSAASARPTIWRAAGRPSWSRWSRPPPSWPRRRRSLVILDEIGRGTSTYDGLAIAWAVVEAMHDEAKSRTLFATHYHELTRLAGRLDCLSLHHVRAREWKGDLVLLHEVAEGAADRSYGIAVARSLACRRRSWHAPSRCWPSSRPGATRPAGSPPGSTTCPCSPRPLQRSRPPTRWPRRLAHRSRRADPA
jgi:DNA mismatch repair protein MutS